MIRYLLLGVCIGAFDFGKLTYKPWCLTGFGECDYAYAFMTDFNYDYGGCHSTIHG